MSEATASIRGEHDSPHGFACIDQHRRDFPVCIIEFENKSDESPFFLFTTFNFRLPASSRMVASLGASVWPHAIPCVLNIWDAASEHGTQVIPFFAFTGFVPVILAYVGFSYWTFGGKVGAP